MSKILQNHRFSVVSMIFIAAVAISSIVDIVSDIGQGASQGHIIQELAIVCFSVVLLLVLIYNVVVERNENQRLKAALVAEEQRSATVSQQLLAAKKIFGEEIAQQFSTWHLTESEAEVALFTLKGLNSKEIASVRGAAEKTVRNQLTSIYKKSNLNNKHAFIAWFMDGLL